jgi:hypothetical protein
MSLFATDPGSLDRLHDIAVPPPIPWWPPAPAWYVVVALAIQALGVAIWRVAAWWHRNRYRRAALAELAVIEAGSPQARTVSALAELVKRTALAAFPRERVASVSGEEWLAFLDATTNTDTFVRGPGRTLENGYNPGPQTAGPELFAAVRHWLRHHRTT